MVSVEFAHFLGKEAISNYHERSYQEFLKIKDSEGVILVDDYNFSAIGFSSPYDVPVILESSLVFYAPHLLSLLGLENKETIYFKGILIKKRGKWSCACLTSCWYLLRLGIFSSSFKSRERLINILPEKFRKNEQRVIKILNNIDVNLKNKIDYVFIKEDENEV